MSFVTPALLSKYSSIHVYRINQFSFFVFYSLESRIDSTPSSLLHKSKMAGVLPAAWWTRVIRPAQIFNAYPRNRFISVFILYGKYYKITIKIYIFGNVIYIFYSGLLIFCCHYVAQRAHIYNSLIVSVTVSDRILFTGFTTDVTEANTTTSKMMSNSLTGTVHGVPKYPEIMDL